MLKLSPLLILFAFTSAHDYIHKPMQYDARAESGSYRYGYDTGLSGSHQFHQENKDASGRVSGKYGYTGPDGKLRLVRYTAGEDGFRAWTNDEEHVDEKINDAVDTSNAVNKRSSKYESSVPDGSWLTSNTEWKSSAENSVRPPSPSQVIQKTTYNAFSHQNLEKSSKTSPPKADYHVKGSYTKTSPPKSQPIVEQYTKTSPPKPAKIVQQSYQTKSRYIEVTDHGKTSPPKPQQIIQQHTKTSPPKPQQIIQQHTKTSPPRPSKIVQQYQSKSSQYLEEKHDFGGKTSPPKFTQQKEVRSDYRSGRSGTFHTNYSFESPAARYRYSVNHPSAFSAGSSSSAEYNTIFGSESQRVPRCVCY